MSPGAPNPVTTQSCTTGLRRERNGFAFHSSRSNGGGGGCVKLISGPLSSDSSGAYDGGTHRASRVRSHTAPGGASLATVLPRARYANSKQDGGGGAQAFCRCAARSCYSGAAVGRGRLGGWDTSAP